MVDNSSRYTNNNCFTGRLLFTWGIEPVKWTTLQDLIREMMQEQEEKCAIVQSHYELECKCFLPEQSCPWCKPESDEFLGYPSMPDYPVSPDWYEMWELE